MSKAFCHCPSSQERNRCQAPCLDHAPFVAPSPVLTVRTATQERKLELTSAQR